MVFFSCPMGSGVPQKTKGGVCFAAQRLGLRHGAAGGRASAPSGAQPQIHDGLEVGESAAELQPGGGKGHHALPPGGDPRRLGGADLPAARPLSRPLAFRRRHARVRDGRYRGEGQGGRDRARARPVPAGERRPLGWLHPGKIPRLDRPRQAGVGAALLPAQDADGPRGHGRAHGKPRGARGGRPLRRLVL